MDDELIVIYLLLHTRVDELTHQVIGCLSLIDLLLECLQLILHLLHLCILGFEIGLLLEFSFLIVFDLLPSSATLAAYLEHIR